MHTTHPFFQPWRVQQWPRVELQLQHYNVLITNSFMNTWVYFSSTNIIIFEFIFASFKLKTEPPHTQRLRYNGNKQLHSVFDIGRWIYDLVWEWCRYVCFHTVFCFGLLYSWTLTYLHASVATTGTIVQRHATPPRSMLAQWRTRLPNLSTRQRQLK